MADAGKYVRVDIGFAAGAHISIRMLQPDYDKLRTALDGERGWHDAPGEDATVALDLAQVAYVRLDTERGRVGF